MSVPGGIRLLLSALSDGVILVDGEGCISFMNPQAEALTGRQLGSASGKDIWEICRLVDRNTMQPINRDMEQALTRDGYFNFPLETVIIPADGDERLVTGGVFLSDGTGKGTEFMQGVILRDLDSRRLLDSYSRKYQRCETLRQLAAGVSGNLKDLLTVLLARLSGINQNHEDRVSVQRMVRDSKKVIGKMNSMISSLSPPLDLTDRSSEICLVEKVLRSSVAIFTSAFPEIQIEIAFPDRTGYAAIPPELLEQVLLNLLTNAGQASGARGKITLTACRIDLASEMKPLTAGSHVMISVRDRGCGISEDQLSRIFDPFYSTSRDRNGLGLSAVYSLAVQYGGHVTVHSVLGAGSQFTVYLPSPGSVVTESMTDTVPTVHIAGFQESEIRRLSSIIESLGCRVSAESIDGSAMIPMPHDEDSPSFSILLAEYDYYMSEIERLGRPRYSRDGVLAVINESYRSPGSREPDIHFLSGPLSLDRMATAIAGLAWKRGALTGERTPE